MWTRLTWNRNVPWAVALLLSAACGDSDPAVETDAGAIDAASDTGTVLTDAGGSDAGATDNLRCGLPEPTPDATLPGCEPSMAGETVMYVIDSIAYARPTSEGGQVITGFDVDGKVSDLSDQETCFKADYLSNTPEMTPGIDNEMGVALARLGVDDNFNDGFVNAIQRGDLLTLLEISDIDDYENDPCVHVDFLVGTLPSGVTAPMVDGDGRLTLDQTFDVRETSYSSSGGPARYRMRDARIVSGRLEGTVEEFNLPTPVPTEFVALGDVPQFMVRLETAFAEEGFDDGVLGGAMSIEATVAGARNGGAEPDIQDAVRSLMVGAADLYPIDNECRCASVGYTVSGRRVTRGSVVP